MRGTPPNNGDRHRDIKIENPNQTTGEAPNMDPGHVGPGYDNRMPHNPSVAQNP